MTGPNWARLSRRAVADRKNEIHLRRACNREFVPALGSEAFGWIAKSIKNLQRERVDFTLRLASCGERAEAPLTFRVENGFCQDRSGRIPGAKKEDVVDAIRH